LFVRQRLSSEPDRYRGRRRVPPPPRSRYAAVGLSAFVGAGVVAMGAAANLPDAKAVSPTVLKNLENASVSSQAFTDRAAESARANRSLDRDAKLNPDQLAKDVWRLPLNEYTFTSPYGVRWGKLHAGIDLAAPEGVPYMAVHAGQVTQAGYNGGYGYSITVKQENGIEIIYAHSRRLLVKKGDRVTAGQIIGEVGNTGYSYGPHLHLEVQLFGHPIEPVGFLREVGGVDIKLQVESVYGGTTSAAS